MSPSSAISAASWQHAAMVAPVKPSVCCASCSKLTSGAKGMARVCTPKMAARPALSGGGTGSSLHGGQKQAPITCLPLRHRQKSLCSQQKKIRALFHLSYSDPSAPLATRAPGYIQGHVRTVSLKTHPAPTQEPVLHTCQSVQAATMQGPNSLAGWWRQSQ